MARLTIEDCLEKIDNRFELLILAAKRARDISLYGKTPFVDSGDDKPTVIALREVAEGFINMDYLKQEDGIEELYSPTMTTAVNHDNDEDQEMAEKADEE